MVLFPLTFASNVFVDPTTMPGGCGRSWRSTRSACSSTPSRAHARHRRARPIGVVLLTAVLLVAIFGPLTMRLYRPARDHRQRSHAATHAHEE